MKLRFLFMSPAHARVLRIHFKKCNAIGDGWFFWNFAQEHAQGLEVAHKAEKSELTEKQRLELQRLQHEHTIELVSPLPSNPESTNS